MTDLEWSPVTVRLGDLSHWAENPVTLSKAQAKKLLKSTERLGRMQTLAIGPSNGDGKHPLYDGHQRVNVWGAAFGMELQVNALQSSRPLTDEERHQVPIMLRTAAGSLDWDALAGWDANNLMDWGFDSDMLDGWKRDIAALGNLIESEAPEPQDAEPQIDRAEELQEKWQVKTGDLWRIGEHRLLCGDSTKREDVERVIQGERAGALFTSPPYGVGLDYESHEDTFAACRLLIHALADIAEKHIDGGGFAVVNFGDLIKGSGPAETDEPCEYPMALEYWPSFRDKGFVLWARRVWVKYLAPGLVGPWTASSNRAAGNWEQVWTWKKTGKARVGHCERSQWGVIDYRSFEGEESQIEHHPGYFPAWFAEYFVRIHTLDGDAVIEPFCGSGTTIVACQNLSRKCRAIEISPAYCAVALERMSTAFPALTIERVT